MTSTAAKHDATQHTALGYARASQVLTPSGGIFRLHNRRDRQRTIIKYTYYGDADLDGDADGVDIGTWATNFTGELSGGAAHEGLDPGRLGLRRRRGRRGRGPVGRPRSPAS